MRYRKSLLMLSILLFAGSLALVFYRTEGAAKAKKVRVLRRHHERRVKPKREEVARLQDDKKERTFKTREFHQMPVAVHEVKNLQSDTWYDDLKIVVKNVSKKPIYFISAYLQFPDVPAPGNAVSGIILEFGNRKNGNLQRIPDPRDVVLNPGEVVALTIHKQYRAGLKAKQERQPENVKKFEFHFGHYQLGWYRLH